MVVGFLQILIGVVGIGVGVLLADLSLSVMFRCIHWISKI